MKKYKPIQKTIRISTEIFNFINDFEGKTFNDKFNNLLNFYILQDNNYRKNLIQLENQIEEKKQLLSDFQSKITKFQNLLK